MVANEDERLGHPKRTQASGEGDLRRLIDDAVIELAPEEQWAEMSGGRHLRRQETRSLVNGETSSSDDRRRHESLVELVHILGRVKRLERQVLDIGVDLQRIKVSSESIPRSVALLTSLRDDSRTYLVDVT